MRDNEQRNENRETVADIVSEMRGMGNYQRYSGDHAHALADRIEAAWKRERAKVEADALAVGGIVEAARTAEESSATGSVDLKFDLCRNVESVLRIGREFQKQDLFRGAHHDTAKLLCDTIEYLRDSLNTQSGNSAAMREALHALKERFRDIDLTHDSLEKEIYELANAALSAPARNCDLYDDAVIAWRAWLEDKDNWDEFGSPKLELCGWLFASAKKKGECDGK